MVYVDQTIPLPAEPSHTLPRPLSSVRPKWPASLNSRPVLALGTFCLHRLIYSFRTLTPGPCSVQYSSRRHRSMPRLGKDHICSIPSPPTSPFKHWVRSTVRLSDSMTRALSRPFKKSVATVRGTQCIYYRDTLRRQAVSAVSRKVWVSLTFKDFTVKKGELEQCHSFPSGAMCGARN